MLYIEKDNVSFYSRLADIFWKKAVSSVKESGRFWVALSGGKTPRKLHRMFVKPPYSHEIPWERTKIFWVDERCVPMDDPASNYGNAREDFLAKLPNAENNAFPMRGDLPPVEAAKSYASILKKEMRVKEGDLPSFHLILLGMGADGHVASLFPGTRSDVITDEWVVTVKGGDPNVHRLTLSYSVLNMAKTLVFMVSGKSKAQTVKRVMKDPERHLPAQFIAPQNGKLIWVLDRNAASLL